MEGKKRVNNSKNREVFYPTIKYKILIHRLNKFMGFNSAGRTTDHIVRSFFDDRPELVAKLEKLKLEDND